MTRHEREALASVTGRIALFRGAAASAVIVMLAACAAVRRGRPAVIITRHPDKHRPRLGALARHLRDDLSSLHVIEDPLRLDDDSRLLAQLRPLGPLGLLALDLTGAPADLFRTTDAVTLLRMQAAAESVLAMADRRPFTETDRPPAVARAVLAANRTPDGASLHFAWLRSGARPRKMHFNRAQLGGPVATADEDAAP